MTSALKADHRTDRLLVALGHEDFASLEPHLEIVDLPQGKVLCDTGESIGSPGFPHSAVVALLEVLEDGRPIEVAMFGREGVFGLVGALVSRGNTPRS